MDGTLHSVYSTVQDLNLYFIFMGFCGDTVENK